MSRRTDRIKSVNTEEKSALEKLDRALTKEASDVVEAPSIQLPSLHTFSASVIKLFATGFGTGLLFPFPGTWGSVLPVFLAWFVLSKFPAWYLAVLPFLFLFGAYIATGAEKIWAHDDRRIVIDEFVGILVALFLLPRSLEYYIAGFILFRAFDIIKPFPARRSELLPGGWGVMADDLIAGIYANILLQLFAVLVGR